MLQEALVTDLERAQCRLGVLEAESESLAHRESDLQHQRELLSNSLGQEEQGTYATHTTCFVAQIFVCIDVAVSTHTLLSTCHVGG